MRSQPDDPLDFFDEENWIGGIRGFNRLVRYSRKVGDPSFQRLCQLVMRPEDVPELAAAASLIWYLDSGGRRNYLILSRPDHIDRTNPSPDFLLEDQVTRHKIALEVTRVFKREELLGALPIKRRVAYFLGELLNDQELQVPGQGSFQVILGPGSLRGRKLGEAVGEMGVAVSRAAGSMRDNEEVVLNQVFRISCIREREYSDGRASSFYVKAEEDYLRFKQAEDFVRRGWEERRNSVPDEEDIKQRYRKRLEDWHIPDGILTAIRGSLAEAKAKFTAFPDVECGLLITLGFPLFADDQWLYIDRLSGCEREFPDVNRLYIWYEDEYSTQWRISRVW